MQFFLLVEEFEKIYSWYYTLFSIETGGCVKNITRAPKRHETPAIINGVIQIEGSPANWAESLKYPAINGPAIPAIP